MWVPITLLATVIQVARTASQQRLRSRLSVSAAGFVRYLYGAPLAIGACVVAVTVGGQELPPIPARFWPVIAAAGVAQVLGTVALITAFDQRDYAIGTVYAKTEVLQVAIFSTIFLDEPLAVLGWFGVVVCMVGVVWLATPPGTPWRALGRMGDRAAVAGLAAGGLFALAAVGIRAASTSLGDGPAVMRALVTVAAMNTIQTLVNGGQLALRERDQLALTLRSWRTTAVVGMLSVCGSAAWALAVTLQSATKVRTLGQVELLLTFAVSHRYLDEDHDASELAASALVLVGVLGVLLFG
jgi:drug/metabolite transporter (DMT)-like permease